MRACSLVLALAASPVPSALADEQQRVPFRVEFSDGLHCGKPHDFSAELLSRSQHVRPARSGEDGFAFRIDVREGEGALEGRLTLKEPDGRITVRAVPGATCSEILPALAVIAAVLVEPSTTIERPAPAAPVAPPPVARTEAPGWGFGASVGPVLQGAVAPDARWGISVEAHAAFETGQALSPLFALAYNRTQTGEATTTTGTAELDWWTARASLCPVRWPELGRLALRPCALFDLGRLDAQGNDTQDPRSAGMTWVAPGTSARFDASPLAGLWLIAEAGVSFPMNRDRFYFDPPRTFAFQPPGLGALGRLAVGGRFE